MFQVLEAQSIIDGHADLIMVPQRSEFMGPLLAVEDGKGTPASAPPPLPAN